MFLLCNNKPYEGTISEKKTPTKMEKNPEEPV